MKSSQICKVALDVDEVVDISSSGGERNDIAPSKDLSVVLPSHRFGGYIPHRQ